MSLCENSQGAPGGSAKDSGVRVGQEQPATVECFVVLMISMSLLMSTCFAANGKLVSQL